MSLLPRRNILAVAAVTDIALNAGDRPVSGKDVAARHHLSPRHLEPVLQALVREGILTGVRGPHGGYKLARDARRITAENVFSSALARLSVADLTARSLRRVVAGSRR